MRRLGRIYWLTWALLVLGAAATGVASVDDAFFRGAFGAFLAPLALRLYEEAGPRAAAFLGLVTGILWQLILTYGWGALVWSEPLRAYALSRLEIDLSVSAAAFAGAALAGAMAHRDARFARAALVGGSLALAMTALPYGFIRSSEATRMGPVEVTWLAPASATEEDGRPWRPKGTAAPTLTPADIAFLRESFLIVEVAGEIAAVDTQGRRLWPVWRRRLTHPDHEEGPVRRVFVACTRAIDDHPKLTLALPDAPDAACALELDDNGFKVVAGAATITEPYALLGFKYAGALDRLIDMLLGRGDGKHPVGLHAPAYLRLDDCDASIYERADAPWDAPMIHIFVTVADGTQTQRKPVLWMLRRTATETPGEADQRPIPKSDRFYGFALTMPGPKPPADRRAQTTPVNLPDVRVRHTVDHNMHGDTELFPELSKDAAPAAAPAAK